MRADCQAAQAVRYDNRRRWHGQISIEVKESVVGHSGRRQILKLIPRP
jgi:hypothetical protein